MKNKIVILLEIISICLIGYLIFTKEARSQEIYKSPNIKVYAFEKVLDKWGDKQWVHFSELVYKESEWKDTADNTKSSAYGLGQFLDSSLKNVGFVKKTPKKKKKKKIFFFFFFFFFFLFFFFYFFLLIQPVPDKSVAYTTMP